MVQSKTIDGFTIIALPDAAIYGNQSGDAVVVWGANGKGVPDEVITLVAQPESYHYVAPLLKLSRVDCLVMINGDAPEQLPSGVEIISVNHPKQAASELSQKKNRIALALNLPELTEIASGVSDNVKNNMLIFVYTRVGCGIGACRACYLHDSEIQTGVAVCCEGPYLPYNSINFEIDKSCFQVFI